MWRKIKPVFSTYIIINHTCTCSNTRTPKLQSTPTHNCWRWIMLPPPPFFFLRGGGGKFIYTVYLNTILIILLFCHSVLLYETSTLLITSEQWVLDLWYFTGVFFVTRPLRGYNDFSPCNLDPFKKKINLANVFWKVSVRALIFHMSIAIS